jgi:hypothetical protein
MSADLRLLELKEELARRQSGVQPILMSEEESTQSPDDARLEELHQELANRQAQAKKEAESIVAGDYEPKEWQKFLRGLTVSGKAGLIDMLDLIKSGAEPSEEMNKKYEAAPDYLKPIVKFMNNLSVKNKVSMTERGNKKFHEITGFPETPPGEEPGISEITGQILDPTSGELIRGLASIPKVISSGIKVIPKLAKQLASRGAESLGAATAIKELPNFSEEGSALNLPEVMAKGVIGGMAGRGLMNASKLIPTKKNLAKAASLFSNPNEELFNLAEKQGVELPVNVGMNSRPLNFLSNYFSKSMFGSKDFKESIKKADKSMLKSAQDKMNLLGVENVEPSTASRQFKDFLVNEEKEANEVIKKAYNTNRALIGESDTVVPTNTKKTIQAMKHILEAPVKDKDTKMVSKIVLDLATEWKIAPKKIAKEVQLGNAEKVLENPQSMREVINAIQKSMTNEGLEAGKIGVSSQKAIPLQQLDTVSNMLGSIIGNNKVYGMKKWLVSLKKSVDMDLKGSSNKEYVLGLKKADKLYEETYASRFKEDLAHSIMTGKEPLFTYNQLNDTHTLQILDQIAGESPKAKTLVNSLKKAKVREIFNKAYTTEGVNTGNFARIFDRDEVSQEFLKKLLGSEAYEGMADLASIMKEQQAAGREILNTSGTAYTASDFKILSKFGAGTVGAIGYLFGTNPTLAVAGLGGAVTAATAINGLSRIMADPAFVKQARAFAIARKNNNIKYSEQLLNQMGKTAYRILTTQGTREPKETEDHE